MSFRIWTIFYVSAVVAASLATFGAIGLLYAGLVLVFWAAIFYGPPRIVEIAWLILIALYLLTVIAIFVPVVVYWRQAPPDAACRNNLRQLVYALITYDATRGRLPASFATDEDGTPLLSWPVLVLPWLERQELYEQIDLSQSWDSPTNQLLLSQGITIFNCPSDYSYPPSPTTDYLAVVGEHTVWLPDGRPSLRRIKDERSQTILLIEIRNTTLHWAEPGDLTLDEAVDLLSSPLKEGDGHRVENGFFYKPSSGRNVAFSDGHVALLPAPLDRGLARALLTVDGGEPIDRDALAVYTSPELDYAKCYVFGVFVVLAVLPAAWLGRRAKPEASASEADEDGEHNEDTGEPLARG